MHHLDRRPRVDQNHALRFAPRDLEKPIAHPREKRLALFLEAVLIVLGVFVATPRSTHARAYIGIHQDGQLRPQAAANKVV